MRRRVGAVGVIALVVGSATVTASAVAYAHDDTVVAPPAGPAGQGEVIDTSTSTPMGALAVPVAQNFRPTSSGRLVRVTVWSIDPTTGQAGEVTIHRGDRPGDVVARQQFSWTGQSVTVTFDQPTTVSAGAVYTLQTAGAVAGVTFSSTDPYAGGEVTMQFDGVWQTWSEWNGCGTGGMCLPYYVDQRLVIEIEGSVDADRDGIHDAADLCPGTVLPDPAVGQLRRNRIAATVDGFVDRSGDIVATLEDTHGCSGSQIVDLLHLGEGQRKYGLTWPNYFRWYNDPSH